MNALNCPICFDTYNQKEKKPMTLICGHTFCYYCLDIIASNNNGKIDKCSFCNEIEPLIFKKIKPT